MSNLSKRGFALLYVAANGDHKWRMYASETDALAGAEYLHCSTGQPAIVVQAQEVKP